MQPWPTLVYAHPPRAEGALLDIPVSGAVLPPICCKCGARDDLRARVASLVWVNPLAYLGLLGGLFPMMILVLVLQKRAHVTLPICGRCNERWSRGILFRHLAVAAPFVLGLSAFYVADALWDDVLKDVLSAFAVFLVLIVALPIAVVKLVTEPRSLTAVRIDDHRAKVRGVSPELLRALGPTPPWP